MTEAQSGPIQAQTSKQLVAEQSMEIHSPITPLFNYLANMENFSQWFPGVLKIEALTGKDGDSSKNEKLGLEQRYIEQVKIPGRGLVEVNLKVSEFRSPTFFQTQGDLKPLLPQMTIKLEELSSERTLVEWKMISRNNSLGFHFFLLPLIRRVMKKRSAIGMKNLQNQFNN